jgi:tetratricopeptide (TPR) repeat protein
MPIITDKELSAEKRALWLKALSAIELRNYGYAISLISNVIKDSPGFLEGRKVLRRAEIAATKGRKSFLSGLSTASLKGGGMVKKDPLAAMELAEKTLESDPYNAQANHLLKDAAKAADYPEIAAFALETIVESNPKDTKLMHELATFYISMGLAEKAVEVYNRISSVNPQDLVAIKMGKDASAQASMTKGGWEKAQSYRDLIKDKDQAKSLEEKGRVMRDIDMIENQIAELQPLWEQDQTNVDLSKRVAKLWDERFEQKQDEESLSGVVWYYNFLNDLLKGSDPAVARKLSDFHQKQTDMQIKQYEDWLGSEGAEEHPDYPQYRDALEGLKQQKASSMIDEAKKRVERNPTDLQLRFELGERLLAAGNFNDAVPELQKARQNPNTRLRAMSLLGRCFVLKGMQDMAANQFLSAASEMTAMDAVKKETLYELAMVYEKMGKTEDYLKCLKDIIEVDYGYRDAAQRVEQSYQTS